jgi:hypothetical protein
MATLLKIRANRTAKARNKASNKGSNSKKRKTRMNNNVKG